MKLVDDVEFQKRNAWREVKNYKIDNFEMEVLEEGALDKSPEGPGNIYMGENLEDNLWGHWW